MSYRPSPSPQRSRPLPSATRRPAQAPLHHPHAFRPACLSAMNQSFSYRVRWRRMTTKTGAPPALICTTWTWATTLAGRPALICCNKRADKFRPQAIKVRAKDVAQDKQCRFRGLFEGVIEIIYI